MSNRKKSEAFVPVKNYIVAAFIIIAIIFLTWYGFAWYNVFKENKVATSYLVKEKVISNEIKSLDEVEAVFTEAPTSYYIYVSYTGSEDIYNMEKELRSLIVDYNLNDSIYFLNVTTIKEEENYIEKLNNALKLKEKKITKVPTIIYYKDGKAVDIITRSDNNIMNVGDFQKLLDVNNVAKE